MTQPSTPSLGRWGAVQPQHLVPNASTTTQLWPWSLTCSLHDPKPVSGWKRKAITKNKSIPDVLLQDHLSSFLKHSGRFLICLAQHSPDRPLFIRKNPKPAVRPVYLFPLNRLEIHYMSHTIHFYFSSVSTDLNYCIICRKQRYYYEMQISRKKTFCGWVRNSWPDRTRNSMASLWGKTQCIIFDQLYFQVIFLFMGDWEDTWTSKIIHVCLHR